MPRLTAVAAAFLLLFASLPFNFDRLSAHWCILVCLALVAVLLQWAPRVVPGRWTQLALWLSVSIFFASLLGRTGFLTADSLTITLALGVWFALLRSSPGTPPRARLRKVALTACAFFAASAAWALHTRMHDARGAAHWGVDFLAIRRAVESVPPADSYAILWLGKASTYASLAALIVSSAFFFFIAGAGSGE